MSDGVADHLGVAEEMLATAKLTADHGDHRTAADRLYFSMLHAATALLLADGIETRSHGRLIAEFGARYARTRKLDPVHHRRLMEAFERRQLADYDASAVFDPDDIEDAIAGAREFLSAIRAQIAARGSLGAGGDFDPEEFNPDATNEAMAITRSPWNRPPTR